MADSSKNVPPKARHHSRTGCTVCKIRHLKCNEARPTCRQCSSAGWKCEYVPVQPVVRRPRVKNKAVVRFPTPSASIYRPTAAISTNARDRGSFYSYQRATELDVTSFFRTDSWSRVVLQMSYHEDAVKHAVFALGMLLADKSSGAAVSHPPSAETYVLEHYTSALRRLREGSVSGPQSPRTVLALCLCFTWIELLRDDLDSAFTHVQAGAAIMEAELARDRQHRIDPCLLQALGHIHAHAQFHGCQTQVLNQTYHVIAGAAPSPACAGSFANINEARVHLDRISASTTSLMRQMKQANDSSRLPHIADPAHRVLMTWIVDAVKAELAAWQHAWTSSRDHLLTLPRDPPHDPRKLAAAVCVLEMQHAGQVILLGCLDDATESCFAHHLPDFARILDSAERFLDLTKALGTFPLSFESAVITPLFLANMKCPHIPLRRRALQLLRRCAARENVWSKERAIEVAVWKLRKEMRMSCYEPGGDDKDADFCLPTESRLHREKLTLQMVDGRATPVVRYRVGSRGDEVEEVLGGDEVSETLAELRNMC